MREESEMYPILGNTFQKEGYMVLKNEFSLLNNELVHNEPDIVAFKWGPRELIDALAIECKLLGSAKKSTLFSIQQAIEYQTSIPRVYICSESGDVGHVGKILKSLKIGHCTIDSRRKVDEKIPARRSKLFNEDHFNSRIKDRLIMLLAFRDVFGEGEDVRRGEFKNGGWIAKKYDDYIQFRCGFDEDCGKVVAGLNLERKDGFRNIYHKIGEREFLKLLYELPKDFWIWSESYTRIDEKTIEEILDHRVHEVDTKDLKRTVKLIKKVLDRRDKRERLHLTIEQYLWDNKKSLSREEYKSKINDCYKKIEPIIGYLDEV